MYKKALKITLVSFIFLNVIVGSVSAQLQFFNFSGNDPESYQCTERDGTVVVATIYKDAVTGYYECTGVDNDGIPGNDRAKLIPPTLQQVEIWFVRIVYVVWALVGAYAFILLAVLGYQYMLRGGTSDTELVTLRKKIGMYAAGFALVFLAIPILGSVFRLLGVNRAVECYDVNMPGFQFFYAELCTDPRGIDAGNIIANPCDLDNLDAIGRTCTPVGRRAVCLRSGTPLGGEGFECRIVDSNGLIGTWQFI